MMAERHLFIVYGGTGDLTRRKLLPSLYRVMTENGVGDESVLLGVSTTEMTDVEYRAFAREALSEHGVVDHETWCDDHVYYTTVGRDPGDLAGVRKKIAEIEAGEKLPGNRIFYLALPPVAFPTIIEALGDAGLSKSSGWTRLVIEKPFGHDLESALSLNRLVHRYFDESQIYRIDHYLGKETVQNLLAFRFANPLFELSWNRDRIESIQITVAESLGIGERADYYDRAGVLRDMVQNHLTQVLTLVAMEAPSSFAADAVRNEKVQVLESIAVLRPEDVVFGQYTAGTIDDTPVVGYLDEDHIDKSSKTPTFVALNLRIQNWRWQGVPVSLRTGKRLPAKTSYIDVRFKRPPVCIFHGFEDTCDNHQNIVRLILQPNEGFQILFDVKAPGDPVHLEEQALSFDYADAFSRLPDAYQTLILDVMNGDQTLFVRADEVEASWRLYDPVLDQRHDVHPYPAGSWGPAEVGSEFSFTRWAPSATGTADAAGTLERQSTRT